MNNIIKGLKVSLSLLYMLVYFIAVMIISNLPVILGLCVAIMILIEVVVFKELLIASIVYYGFIYIVICFLIKKVMFIQINKSTSISLPFIPWIRKLNQESSWSNRVCSRKDIYKSFVQAVNSFIKGDIKIFRIPIKRLNLNTHEIIIWHIMKRYGIQEDEITRLLQNDKLRRSTTVNHNGKNITVIVKFRKVKLLSEEAILQPNPFKYLWTNYEQLLKYDYALTLIVR